MTFFRNDEILVFGITLDLIPHLAIRIPQYRQKEVRMEIKWYGHSAFLITSDQGVKIITDPYESGAYGGQLSYGKIKDKGDIALTSHDHADHNDTKSLPGSPKSSREVAPKR